MISYMWLSSFAYANDLSVLDQYLKSIDKPKPGIERFNTKTINHKSYSGWVCTYKEQLEKTHELFVAELKAQRSQYEQCNFSTYVTYLFDKKDLKNDLINIISQLPYKELSPYNYIIRDKNYPGMFTLSFICKDCEDSQEAIQKNISTFVQNTCVHDKPDNLTTEEVEILKKNTNRFSRTDQAQSSTTQE